MKFFKLIIPAIILCSSAIAQTNSFPSSGNVGIGTTSPSGNLHVLQSANDHAYSVLERSNNGYQAFRSFRPAGTVSITNPIWLMGMKQSSPDFEIQTYNGVNSTERLYIQTNGNIGVGTNNPQSRFAVVTNNLGGTSGETVNITSYETGIGSYVSGGSYNTSKVNIYTYRNSNGNDWLTASTRIQQRIDATDMGYIEFNPVGGSWGLALGSNSGEIMRLSNSGNVGVGTTSPSSKLHIVDGNNYVKIGDVNGSSTSVIELTDVSPVQIEGFEADLRFTTSGTERVRITSGGNLGIGTASPAEKLSVNGNIVTKKVKVTQTGWADYVFHPTYKLPPLKEVESYIKQHQHLPDIPSAKEVEENGLDLGSNQAALLKKIEELTLYVIEQNKRIEQLEKKIRSGR